MPTNGCQRQRRDSDIVYNPASRLKADQSSGFGRILVRQRSYSRLRIRFGPVRDPARRPSFEQEQVAGRDVMNSKK